MILRIAAVLLTLGYIGYSVFFAAGGGFQDPQRAVWVGLVGMIVMAVAMTLFRYGRKKKK